MTQKDKIKEEGLKIGDIVEIDYQKQVAYVKGFSKKDKANDGQPLVLIHHEWDSSRSEWWGVARQRLRLINNDEKTRQDTVDKANDIIGCYFEMVVNKKHIPKVVKKWCVAFESELKKEFGILFNEELKKKFSKEDKK